MLCGKEKELCESHFVPKFVYDWIKKTSATGYIRQAININKRIQDGIKEKFLCPECEAKFSKYEQYFADVFFYPYLNKTKTSFNYDENLQKFIISISWRLLKKDLNGFKEFRPEMFEYAQQAEKYWREILLNDKLDEKYEHHLFLLGYVESSTMDLPEEFQWYLMRATDGTIASSKQESFLFTKLPAMCFISSIFPNSIKKYWGNTLIGRKGVFGENPQSSQHPGFGDFLMSRVNYLTKAKLSEHQITKIEKTMLKNLDRTRNSKSFERGKRLES
jgi:hypothetical protein